MTKTRTASHKTPDVDKAKCKECYYSDEQICAKHKNLWKMR